MAYTEASTTYDFPMKWDGTNTDAVVGVIAEWAAVVFKDEQFPQYVTVAPHSTQDTLFLVHPGATMLAIINRGEMVCLPYKKGIPYGAPPILSVSEEVVAAAYDEVE